MAKDPSFPWYASDWLGSNRRAMMTLEQQGAYMNLLCRQWADKTCSLPDDDEALARLSELNEGWFKGGSTTLRACFPKHPILEGRIASPKLLELRAERNEWLEKSREGGRKSAAARKKRRKKGGSTTLGTNVEPPLANGKREKEKESRTKKEKERKRSPSPSPSIKEVPNGTSTPCSPPKQKSVEEQDFDAWWKLWPAGKKIAKEAARRAYGAAAKRIAVERACGDSEARTHLRDRLAAFVKTPKCLGEFCPNPSTWLNGGRYDDDPSAWEDHTPQSKGTNGGRIH